LQIGLCEHLTPRTTRVQKRKSWRAATRRSALVNIFVTADSDHNARLLSFTAAASTYTSLPSFLNFSDICAMPCSLSLSVAA
jgi:hypothetical protein